jgi:hypothetical protein
MISTSALYNSIFADENHVVEWKITVNGTAYEKDKIAAAAGGDSRPKLKRSLLPGSDPTIGGCVAATFSCAIFEASSAVPRMATVVPAYRLALGSSVSEWITLGTFFIDTRQVDKVTGALILTCYDKMLVADGAGGATYADLTGFDEWPQSQSAVVAEIASIMGISVDSRTSIGSGDGYKVEYPNDLTMREVLGNIGVANAGNWCITPANSLRLVPLTGGSDTFNLGAAVSGLKISPAFASWTGVTVYWDDEEAYEAGTDTGRVLTCDCPWATQATANGILTALSGSAYQPYTSEGAIINLALELGDIVTVGLTGDQVIGPVFTIDITGGALEQASISAPGEDEIDHEYPYASYVDRSLKRKVGLDKSYYGVTISRKKGIEIARGDGLSEALFNSDVFTMRALIDGVMKDRIYFDPIKGDYVFDGALGADAVFTDSLYAEQGDIAELTVDRLSTSRRIRKYILQDTSDDNFIKIQDQYIRWVTGTIISSTGILTEDGLNLLTESGIPLTEEVGSAATEQATNRYGQGLYWQEEPVGHTSDGYPTDADGVQIYATTNPTQWPVAVYKYTELVKSEYAFDMVGQNYIPQVVLGAGDENGNSKGYIYKDELGFYLRYKSSAAKNVDIRFSDDGFVDAMHRRLSWIEIDTMSGNVLYGVEGDNSMYRLSFTQTEDSATFTWPDGFQCEVSVS